MVRRPSAPTLKSDRKEQRQSLLVWVVVLHRVMVVHYRLFKRAGWYNRRSTEAAGHCGLFDFCGANAAVRSPAARAIGELAQMLFAAFGLADYPDHLRPLARQFGALKDWPASLLHKFQSATALALSMLWRHFWHTFKSLPWPMVKMVDPLTPVQEREEIARQMFHSNACCRDRGCAGRVLSWVTTWRELLEPGLVVFLRALFRRAVITSTFVERLFAFLTRWSEFAPQGVETLGAKAVVHDFERQVEAWRAAKENAAVAAGMTAVADRSARCRPIHVAGCKHATRNLKGVDLWKREKKAADGPNAEHAGAVGEANLAG